MTININVDYLSDVLAAIAATAVSAAESTANAAAQVAAVAPIVLDVVTAGVVSGVKILAMVTGLLLVLAESPNFILFALVLVLLNALVQWYVKRA